MENIQKHLGLFLDPKLNFFDHVKKIKKNDTKRVSVMRKMNLLLPHFSLLAI